MLLQRRIQLLLSITRSHHIVRRYLVVNGFDGALTMLGLIMGFIVNVPALSVVINACLGAAIALGMSGLSSAYISESAERQRELDKLQAAMLDDLEDSAHNEAVRWVPWFIALVNGLAPLLISLLIISPMILADAGVELAVSALHLSIAVALLLVFLLGVFLGQIASVSWWRSGIRTLFIALFTAGLIYLTTAI